jgi:hypothetical protein
MSTSPEFSSITAPLAQLNAALKRQADVMSSAGKATLEAVNAMQQAQAASTADVASTVNMITAGIAPIVEMNVAAAAWATAWKKTFTAMSRRLRVNPSCTRGVRPLTRGREQRRPGCTR